MGICSTRSSAGVYQHYMEMHKLILVEELSLHVALWQGFKSMQMKLWSQIFLFKKTPTFTKSCHEGFCKLPLISNTVLMPSKYSEYLELISYSVLIMNSWFQMCVLAS